MLHFKEYLEEGKRGLWDNIHAKRKRIKNGSGERMRKPGEKGAPTAADFKAANEEVEQIDELEKKTVHSYLNKADPSQGMRNAEKETPGILKNPNALKQYKKKAKAGVSRALDRLKPKQSVSEAAQIGVGSKVYHPIHGSGKVLKHSTGAGADHWAEVKFLSGNTKRVNRKHLKLEEVVAEGYEERKKVPGWHSDSQKDPNFNDELSSDEQFDMIEEIIEQLAQDNGIDSESIWETLESVDDYELLEYAIDKKGYKSSTGGLTQKGVDAYNRKTGGNLQTAVTTPPSKLKKGSKAWNRRKSFCARMGGVKGPMKDDKGRPTRKALALRKWNC